MLENGASGDSVEQIERSIMQIGWLSHRRFMQLLAEERFDLTIPQFHTLNHLAACEGLCKMSDLARATHQSAASLTGVVDRLLDKRLVERARPEGDRRQVMVTVTERGRTLLVAIAQARRDEMRLVLGELEPDELSELLRLLGAVARGMLELVEDREHPVGAGDA